MPFAFRRSATNSPELNTAPCFLSCPGKDGMSVVGLGSGGAYNDDCFVIQDLLAEYPP